MWKRGKRSRSSSSTLRPRRASAVAALEPPGPPPITATSNVLARSIGYRGYPLTATAFGLILGLVRQRRGTPQEETPMPTIEHKGVKLAYEEKGSGSPAFLFIHGWTCDRSFFKAQADHFATPSPHGLGRPARPRGERQARRGVPDLGLRGRPRPRDRHPEARQGGRGRPQHGRHHGARAGRALSGQGRGDRDGGSRAARLPARAPGPGDRRGDRDRGGQPGAAPAVHRERALHADLRQGSWSTRSSRP